MPFACCLPVPGAFRPQEFRTPIPDYQMPNANCQLPLPITTRSTTARPPLIMPSAPCALCALRFLFLFSSDLRPPVPCAHWALGASDAFLSPRTHHGDWGNSHNINDRPCPSLQMITSVPSASMSCAIIHMPPATELQPDRDDSLRFIPIHSDSFCRDPVSVALILSHFALHNSQCHHRTSSRLWVVVVLVAYGVAEEA